MTTTGANLLTGLSKFIDDFWSSTTTSAGTSTGTTVVDTALQRKGAEALVGGFIRLTSGTSTLQVRRVSGFTGSTATVEPAFSAQVATSVTYEFHKYDPEKKFRALDEARITSYPQLAILRFDETLTGDGYNTEWTLPTNMRKGPAEVWEEDPLPANVSWNLLTNGALTSMSSWSATSVTTAIVTQTFANVLVPRIESACVKLTSGASGYISQDLSTQAAAMAGQRISLGAWVYSRTAGCTVSIETDAGVTNSTQTHLGGGWEFITMSHNVVGTNATTLKMRINPVTNNAVYVERAFFAAMVRIPITYNTLLGKLGVRRDNLKQEVHLRRPPRQGYQLRLIGRDVLSALGTVAATQVTNTMEVDETNDDLLYATAARLLFNWEGWSTDAISAFPRIQVADARWREVREETETKYPYAGWLEVQ